MKSSTQLKEVNFFEPAELSSEKSDLIVRKPLSNFQYGIREFRKNKGALISLFILLIIILLAIFGPLFTKYTYYQTDYGASYQGPSGEHWLGTDKFGRDQWARIWQGTRVSLYIAFLAAILDLIIGVSYGAISAYIGGKVDNIMQRIIEILVGIPHLIVVLLLIMMMKPGIITITVAMVITGWVNMARLVRAQVLKLKGQEFILASKVLGNSSLKVIWKHIIPNSMGLIIINMMFTIPSAIFTEAFLSFIGLGLQEPKASLGVLINSGYQSIRTEYHLLLYPSIVIVLLMVCFNILADGLRDALDPKSRK